MKLRAVGHGDIAAILAIWNPVIRDSVITFTSDEKTADDIAAMSGRAGTPGHAFILAEAPDGDVAGFAAFAPLRNGSGYLRTLEHSVYVAPAHRGGGVGAALMAALTDLATAQGAASLWAAISGANPRAIDFHQRLGFDAAAVLQRVGFKAGTWLDLHLMVKRLAD